MKRNIIILLLVIAVIFFNGCSGSTFEGDSKNEEEATITEKVEYIDKHVSTNTLQPQEDIVELYDGENSVWVVYWDNDNVVREIEQLYDEIDNIYHFAAYFDSENDLFIDNESVVLYEDINRKFPDSEWKNYITIVNDKIESGGKSLLKDTDLLYELFDSDVTMTEHIEQIIEIAQKYSFDGVIIDYENLDENIELWGLYEEFIALLYERCTEYELDLRLTFETNVPIDELSFPDDIGYIIMCYNLYGYHSGPGPKADIDFLNMIKDKMGDVDRFVEYAFSSGGFDWLEESKTVGLTTTEAEYLLYMYEVEHTRDKESNDIVFCYNDENDKKHEVWYADSNTLGYWIDYIREEKRENISIWRLNGIDGEGLLEYLK